MGGVLGGGGVSVDIPTGEMNNMLQSGLNNALGYSEKYTNKAVDAQQQYLQQALQQLQFGTNALNQNFGQSQALQQPYRDLGYRSTDNYADSLGIARPEMGSQALSSILNKDAQAVGYLANMQTAGQGLNALYDAGGYNIGELANAPTMRAIAERNVTNEDINEYIKNNISEAGAPQTAGWGSYSGAGSAGFDNRSSYGTADIHNMAPGFYGNVGDIRRYLGIDPNGKNPQISATPYEDRLYGNAIAQELSKPLFNQANNLYQQQQALYNQFGNFLNGQYNADQQSVANAYNRGLFTMPTTRSNLY